MLRRPGQSPSDSEADDDDSLSDLESSSEEEEEELDEDGNPKPRKPKKKKEKPLPPGASGRAKLRRAVTAVIASNRWRQQAAEAMAEHEEERRARAQKQRAKAALDKPPAARTDDDVAFLDGLTNQIEFFKAQSLAKRLAIARIMRYEFHPPNHVLFRQGDEGEKLYVIMSGVVDVLLKQDDGEDMTVASLTEGKSFGELALGQDGETRAATIMCAEDCEFLTLSREAFQELFADEQSAVRRKMDFFRSLNWFSSWRLANLKRFSYAFTQHEWGRGRQLCRQGTMCASVMFLLGGECMVSRRSALLHHRRSQQLSRAGPGAVFGQLFAEQAMTYSVMSTSARVTVLEISADKFHSMVTGSVLAKVREWVLRLDTQRKERGNRSATAIEAVRQGVYDTMFKGHEPSMDDLLKVTAATAEAAAREAQARRREEARAELAALQAKAAKAAESPTKTRRDHDDDKRSNKAKAEAEEEEERARQAAMRADLERAKAALEASARGASALPERHPQLFARGGAHVVPASRQLLENTVKGPTTKPRQVPYARDEDDPDRPPEMLPDPRAVGEVEADPAPSLSSTLQSHLRNTRPAMTPVAAGGPEEEAGGKPAPPRLEATVELPPSPARAPRPSPSRVPLGSSPTMATGSGDLSYETLDGESYLEWGDESDVFASAEEVQAEVDDRAVRANEAAKLRFGEGTPGLAQRVRTGRSAEPGPPRARSIGALVGVTPIKPTSEELEVFLEQIRDHGLSPPRRRHKPVADIHLADDHVQSHASLFKESLSMPNWRERVIVAERTRGAEKSLTAQYLTEARARQREQERREAERRARHLPKPERRRPGQKPPGMVGNIVSKRNLRKLAEQKAIDDAKHAHLRLRVERMQIEVDSAAFY